MNPPMIDNLATISERSLSERILEQARTLPVDERVKLVEQILDSLDAENDSEAKEWIRRIADIETGNYIAYSPEAVEEFMRNRRRGS